MFPTTCVFVYSSIYSSVHLFMIPLTPPLPIPQKLCAYPSATECSFFHPISFLLLCLGLGPNLTPSLMTLIHRSLKLLLLWNPSSVVYRSLSTYTLPGFHSLLLWPVSIMFMYSNPHQLRAYLRVRKSAKNTSR